MLLFDLGESCLESLLAVCYGHRGPFAGGVEVWRRRLPVEVITGNIDVRNDNSSTQSHGCGQNFGWTAGCGYRRRPCRRIRRPGTGARWAGTNDSCSPDYANACSNEADTPYRSEAGNSSADQTARQTSFAGTPAASASSTVRPDRSASTC